MVENSTPIADLGTGLYIPNDRYFRSNGSNGIVYDKGGGLTITTSGSNLVTPSTNADDLVLNVGVTGGLSILSSGNGYINFGDGASNERAFIRYDHGNDYLRISCKGSELYIKDGISLDLPNSQNITPTVSLSGVLFLSGGALWYKGFGGKYTLVAASA